MFEWSWHLYPDKLLWLASLASIWTRVAIIGDHSQLDTLTVCLSADFFVPSDIPSRPLSRLRLKSYLGMVVVVMVPVLARLSVPLMVFACCFVRGGVWESLWVLSLEEF